MHKFLFEWNDYRGTHFTVFEANYLTSAVAKFKQAFGKIRYRVYEVGDILQDWIN
jgi:hypothetical protein